MRTFQKGNFSCSEMTAYDALKILPEALELFPGEEIVLSGYLDAIKDQDFKAICANKDPNPFFIQNAFNKTSLTYLGQRIEVIEDQFEDVYEMIKILGWALSCSYAEPLSREPFEIPSENPLSRADKILASAKERPVKSGQIRYAANGIAPPNVSPWLFTVLASVDKNKRCDWLLLQKLKTELTFGDFMDIWECIQSSMSYETAEAINNI